MRDFDKFFNERLNEEADFPLREKRWKALAQRLDAAGVGAAAAASSVLLYWKASAAVLALVSAGLLWRVHDLQQENAALRQKIGQHTTWEKPMPRNGETATAKQPEVSILVAPTGTPPGTILSAREAFNFKKQKNAPPLPYPADRPLPTAWDGPANNISPGQTDKPAPDATAEAMGQIPETGSAEAQSPLARASADLLPPRPLAPLPLPGYWPEMPALANTSHHWPFREKTGRFRLGIQGSIVVPSMRPQGVSNLQGAGVALEYMPVRNLWLTASADWLSYDVQSTEYLPPQFFQEEQPEPLKFSISPPPTPPPAPYPLVDIVGYQRVRLLGIGARYVLPVQFWVRPSVQFAHTWMRKAPSVYNFTFKDTLFGPPPQKEYTFPVPQSTKTQRISGLWRLGVAFERETHNWVLCAGVDWMENGAASKPTFGALLVRGGVLYKL